MYMHHKDWQAAIRVAESHDHLLVSKVLSAQAKDVAVSGRGELLTANEKTNAVTGTQQYQAAQAETGQVRMYQIYNPNYALLSDFLCI